MESERFERMRESHRLFTAVVRARLDNLGITLPEGQVDLQQAANNLTCLAYGHLNQPTTFARRYRNTPWRCDRCGTWWRVEIEGDSYSGIIRRTWYFVGDDNLMRERMRK